jgi:hypothetical protein
MMHVKVYEDFLAEGALPPHAIKAAEELAHSMASHTRPDDGEGYSDGALLKAIDRHSGPLKQALRAGARKEDVLQLVRAHLGQ